MKALFAGVAAIALGWPAGANAAEKSGGAGRSVQLIPMQQAPDNWRREAGPIEQDEGGDGASGRTSASFRVHDLSRRWVEFQMGSAMVGELSPSAAKVSGSHVSMVSPEPSVPMIVNEPPGRASIAIPAWMRSGNVLEGKISSYVPRCTQLPYRAAGFLRADAELRRASYYRLMSDIACEYGVPIGLFDAMIIQESRYQPAIYSPKNAFGLTQLMPQTALSLGVDRYSIEGNLRGGAQYLRQQLDRFGQYHLALAAYNAGPGRVREGKLPLIAETLQYVDNVLGNWSRLAGLGGRAAIVSASPRLQWAPPPGKKATVSTF